MSLDGTEQFLGMVPEVLLAQALCPGLERAGELYPLLDNFLAMLLNERR